MIELPEFSPLRVTQHPGMPGRKRFDALDHLAVIVPKRPGDKHLRALPKRAQIKRLLDRSRAGNESRVTVHLDNTRATAMTVSRSPDPHDSFGLLTWARKLIGHCLEHKPRKLGLWAVGLDEAERGAALLALIAAAEAAAFALPSYKSTASSRPRLKTLQLLDAEPRVPLAAARAEAAGNNIARWFTALPPNELTAASYREAIQTLATDSGLEYSFIDERELEKLGAGAFLAVSQGNATRDAGIVRLRYRPAADQPPAAALVGKGILFDTGGNNLKPFKSMLDMHIDMMGSAVALGTAIALATLEVSYAFDVWLAITENRLSATAYKSQDVVRAINGKTIQVIHTDAEGRMVLADALALAAREKPGLIIDYATLTGACIGALTTRYSGVFTNRSGATERLVETGRACGERVWSFPMDSDYDDSLRSEVADIKQCAADGSGDHILAARFLGHFVPDAIPWIHLDLSAGQHKGGLAHIPTEITGFGVRYTLELLSSEQDGPRRLATTLGS